MTKLQRKVLLWVADNGGQMFMTSGYKTTRTGTVKKTGERCVATSIVVLGPLASRGWLRRITQDGYEAPSSGVYELTDAGREAIAPGGRWPMRRIGGAAL